MGFVPGLERSCEGNCNTFRYSCPQKLWLQRVGYNWARTNIIRNAELRDNWHCLCDLTKLDSSLLSFSWLFLHGHNVTALLRSGILTFKAVERESLYKPHCSLSFYMKEEKFLQGLPNFLEYSFHVSWAAPHCWEDGGRETMTFSPFEWEVAWKNFQWLLVVSANNHF